MKKSSKKSFSLDGIMLNRANEKESIVYSILLYILIFLMLFILVFISLFTLCEIRQTSMENNFFEGDYTLVQKTSKNVKVDDIVIISVVDNNIKSEIIKRVVAVGGDSIQFRVNDKNRVDLYRMKKGENDYKKINEPYIKEEMDMDNFLNNGYSLGSDMILKKGRFEIEQGMVFLLGDNRNVSKDSRKYGVLPIKDIVGKSVLKLEKDSFLEKLLLLIY